MAIISANKQKNKPKNHFFLGFAIITNEIRHSSLRVRRSGFVFRS